MCLATHNSSKKRKKRKANGGKLGRKKDHEGVTREMPEPNEWIEVTEEKCPECGSKLGKPFNSERGIIIDIPEPQCIPSRLPSQGNIWKEHTIASYIDEVKYKGRLPYRKEDQGVFEGDYNLDLSTATIFDFTRWVSERLRGGYERILERIRKAKVVYCDEQVLSKGSTTG